MTLETISGICADIAAGVPMKSACGKAGISPMTADRWRETGWQQMEAREDDDTEPMTLHEQFVVMLEAAKVEFQAPLVKQWRKVATGGKGATEASYRASRDLLAATDPTRWSERVAAAGAGKLEVSGGLENSTYHHFERMSPEELDDELDRLDKQIRCGEWSIMKGDEKDAWIDYFQDKVDRMRVDRSGGEKWDGDLRYRIRRGHPVLRDDKDSDRPMAIMPRPIPIDLEATELPAAEYSSLAPIEASGQVSSTGPDASPLVEQAPVSFPGSLDAGAVQDAAVPASSRVPAGFGFDASSGLAIPLYADDFDEDVVL